MFLSVNQLHMISLLLALFREYISTRTLYMATMEHNNPNPNITGFDDVLKMSVAKRATQARLTLIPILLKQTFLFGCIRNLDSLNNSS